jgi:hypothetical protein
MVKYDLIIEQSLKSTALKRIRVKVDPKLVSQENDLSKCDGYEGYILAEHEDGCKVLVISPDELMTMNVPIGHLEDIADDRDESLKSFIMYILSVFRVNVDSPLALQLFTANSIEMIESALKQHGYTDDEVKILYRDFIVKENAELVSEISLGKILKTAGTIGLQGAKAVGRSAISPAAWVKGAGSLVKGIGGVYSAGGLKSGEGLKKLGGGIQSVGSGLESAFKYAYGVYQSLETPDQEARLIKSGKKISDFANYIVTKGLPNLDIELKKKIKQSHSLSDIKKALLAGGVSDKDYLTTYTKFVAATDQQLQAAQQASKSIQTSATPQVQKLTGVDARTAEGAPISGQSRFTTKDGKKSYIYGKPGWVIKDPLTGNYVKAKGQQQITTQWQKTLGITPKAKSQADEELHESRVLSVMAKYQPIF